MFNGSSGAETGRRGGRSGGNGGGSSSSYSNSRELRVQLPLLPLVASCCWLGSVGNKREMHERTAPNLYRRISL